MRGWLDAAGQKSEEIARVSRRQVELLQVEWDLLRRRADLGERALHLITQGEFPGWSRDPNLVDRVEEVRALEKELRRLRAEIEAIRRGESLEDQDDPGGQE